MDTLEIRPARRVDVPQILDLQRAAFRAVGEQYDDAALPPLTETLEQVRATLDTHTVLVAADRACATVQDDVPIVGAVRARVVDDVAHIARLAVRPDAQGRGIGRRLLAAIERSVMPVAAFELFTGDRSERSLRLYERAGYRLLRTVPESDRLSLTYLAKSAAGAHGART